MNCAAIRRRLFALTEPAQTPPGLRVHLETCPQCREVQRQLALVERHIPLLPVPTSDAKARLLQRLRGETTVLDRVRYRVRSVQRWQVVAVGMAASVLLFFLAWNLAPQDQPVAVAPRPTTTPDVLFESLVEHNLKLAVTEEPQLQVATLAHLAEDLRGQAAPLLRFGEGKAGKEALTDLADWYGQAVRMSVARAGQLPAEKRRQTLEPIVRQLTQAYDDAEQSASKIHNISAEHPLKAIAFAAHNGKEQLETLLRRDAALGAPAKPLASGGRQPPVHGRTTGGLRPPLALLEQLGFLPALSVARAEPANPATAAYDQAQRFQRHRKLIQVLVEGCLRMAEQRDLLERASACALAADRLATAIAEAVAEQDYERGQVLAQGLKRLLQSGVAFNLTTVKAGIAPGDVREPALLQIGTQVKRGTDQLTEQLRQAPAERVQKTLHCVADGRAAVVKALQGRGPF